MAMNILASEPEYSPRFEKLSLRDETVISFSGLENRPERRRFIVIVRESRLQKEFGKGFSKTNLEYFRRFYLMYEDRITQTVFQQFAIEKTQTLFGQFRHCKDSIIPAYMKDWHLVETRNPYSSWQKRVMWFHNQQIL